MDEVFIMRGGKALRGEVVIGGAKNAALGIVAGALLTEDRVIIENLPDVRDVNVMLEALKEIGADVQRIDAHTVAIEVKTCISIALMTNISERYALLIILSERYSENTMRRQSLFRGDALSDSVP